MHLHRDDRVLKLLDAGPQLKVLTAQFLQLGELLALLDKHVVLLPDEDELVIDGGQLARETGPLDDVSIAGPCGAEQREVPVRLVAVCA